MYYYKMYDAIKGILLKGILLKGILLHANDISPSFISLFPATHNKIYE
jgi:hypothetical protein